MASRNNEVCVIVGGGPGVSASCARLFVENDMQVAVAARNPNKEVLKRLEVDHNVHLYQCDATDPDSVSALFDKVKNDLGSPRLVVHNIDGRHRKDGSLSEIIRKNLVDADPDMVLQTMKNSAFSAFLVGQAATRCMLSEEPSGDDHRGTIIFTNASAAYKGYPQSGAFAIASHGKSGLAQSMARELYPQGIHVAHVPIDAAIGWEQEDGSRWHRLAGTTKNDNMADPNRIADVYLQIHRQHRSTWAFEVVLRPWLENW
ncbi:MAG: SDR family oxidoreductase [Pseudomonadota bacterium]